MDNNNTVIFLNPKGNKISKAEIESLYRFENRNICINLAHTYKYLENDTIKYDLWYSRLKKEAGDINVLNSKSKAAKLKRIYEEFDSKHFQNMCPPKCCECCNDIFLISLPEFMYILSSLLAKGQYIKLYKFYKKAQMQKRYIDENYEVISKQIYDNFKADDIRFYRIGMSIVSKEPCPFLSSKGRCDIYDDRPSICRAYGYTSMCNLAGNKNLEKENKVFLDAPLIKRADKKYIYQARPIFYFLLKFLDIGNIKNTFELCKKFREEAEENISYKEISQEYIYKK